MSAHHCDNPGSCFSPTSQQKTGYHGIKNCINLCGAVTVTDLSRSVSRLTSQGAARKFFSF